MSGGLRQTIFAIACYYSLSLVACCLVKIKISQLLHQQSLRFYRNGDRKINMYAALSTVAILAA